jgi:peptide/nickel transport system permease protein
MTASTRYTRHSFYVLTENSLTLVSVVLFSIILLLAIIGPTIAPYDPLTTNTASSLMPPSALHWFGTDQLGRDICSRVLVATRLDLVIAASAVSISFVIGSLLGAICGYYEGFLDWLIGRGIDVMMAFPLFVLAMALVAALGNTVVNIVYATAIINIPFYFRLARAEINVRRHSGYVEAARLSGNSNARIILTYLLPNALPTLVVQISINMGWAILNAAGLSFIGLGVRPPTAEWGIMVAQGAVLVIGGQWWVALFPGLALMIVVFCFNLLGDALRDIVDPRRRT